MKIIILAYLFSTNDLTKETEYKRMLLNRQHLNETKRSDERCLTFFVELDFCQKAFFKKIRSILDNFFTFEKITLFLKHKLKKNKKTS